MWFPYHMSSPADVSQESSANLSWTSSGKMCVCVQFPCDNHKIDWTTVSVFIFGGFLFGCSFFVLFCFFSSTHILFRVNFHNEVKNVLRWVITYLEPEPLKPETTAGVPPYLIPTWCHTFRTPMQHRKQNTHTRSRFCGWSSSVRWGQSRCLSKVSFAARRQRLSQFKRRGIVNGRQSNPSLLTIGQWNLTSGSPISSSRKKRWG